MKASDLIRDIVQLAEEKFKVNLNNVNDTVAVGLYPTDETRWTAWLIKPTAIQLQADMDNQVTVEKDLAKKTYFRYEEVHCYVEGSSMMDALHQLYGLIDDVKMVECVTRSYLIPSY